jgi:hypothetical protein
MLGRNQLGFAALRIVSVFCTTLLAFGVADRALGVGLVYVDAVPEDPFFPGPGENLSPSVAITTTIAPDNDDLLWAQRYNFGSGSVPTVPTGNPIPDVPGVFESGIAEDSPVLRQRISGLTPGVEYDLYAVYWTDEDENWAIRTGVDQNNLTHYSWTGESGSDPTPGSLQGLAARMAVWDVPPAPTHEGARFSQRPTDPLVMLLGDAGFATANGSGEIDVFVDDIASAGGGRRTWLDGVAYVPRNTQIAVTATLDRETGALMLNNPTSQAFDIKSYEIRSAISGSLDAVGWTPIADSNASWTVTAPVSPETTPYASSVAENGGATTFTLAASGGSLSFGNVWNVSPFDHILLDVVLADDTHAYLVPHYIGDAITRGDFDLSGVIDVEDFLILLENMHTNVSALTGVERHERGSMTLDAVIDFNDFRDFRLAYEAQGAGSFADLLAAAQVPEPGTFAILAAGAALLMFGWRRRVAAGALALAVCCSHGNVASAQTLLAIDVNDRDVQDSPNTAPGFDPFTLPLVDVANPIGTYDPVPTASGTVNGYNINMTVFDANGATGGVGAMDDRDRVVPTTAPTLNQIYDDFLFVGGSAGATGGLDITISGGALQPNTAYTVSIYAYDGIDANMQSGTPNRVANWMDGNSADATILTTNFTINQPPTTDDQYKFSGLAYTDGAGQLSLKGRRVTAADLAVYVNAVAIDVPVELTLEVNTTTGATRILNEQGISFDLSYYEIRSTSGSLSLGGWTSLDDAEGNPPTDPAGSGWSEVAPPGSTANLLSELRLEGMNTLDPTDELPLGSAFAVGGTADVRFFYAGPNDTALQGGIVKFVSTGVPGDHNGDGSVDAADYVAWRKTPDAFGGTPGGYNLWRQNFGEPSPGGGQGEAAVPEPTSVVSVMLIAFGCLVRRSRN